MEKPKAKRDFQELHSRFMNNIPTTFVRFSDGELEILRNNALSITDGVVRWRLGTLDGRYPQHDNKSFVPERDTLLRSDLIASARYKSNGYFKGIPVSSNQASMDRDFMIDLNGGNVEGLTFSDLFINENYLAFINEVLPLFLEKSNVAFVGNFRANLSQLSQKWSHVPIDDNVFPVYEALFPKLLKTLSEFDPGAVVLSSASSLSNTLGHQLHQARPDITFVDVGTSLNPFVGLGEATRAYQTQLLPWSLKNASRKLKYQLLGNHRMKW
jgi:hypothetical protein